MPDFEWYRFGKYERYLVGEVSPPESEVNIRNTIIFPTGSFTAIAVGRLQELPYPKPSVCEGNTSEPSIWKASHPSWEDPITLQPHFILVEERQVMWPLVNASLGRYAMSLVSSCFLGVLWNECEQPWCDIRIAV